MNHLNPELRLLGASSKMDAVREEADIASRYSHMNVLITGETGTGKNLVAYQIHKNSDRSRGQFVHVNCGAIPYDLAESALFGHEAGAYTDAKRMTTGYFENADGGTLFLDEISNMTHMVQAKLLTATESGTFRRLGGEKDLKSETRVISATNAELRHNPKFRHDLYRRLGGFRIHIPSLRERSDDIYPIARFYLQRLNERYGDAKTLDTDAIATLESYSFPGNIRQLISVLEWGFTHSSDGTITPEIISHAIEREAEEVSRAYVDSEGFVTDTKFPMSWGGARDMFKKELLQNALVLTDGNVSQAASLLQTERGNFYRYARSLGYSPEQLYKEAKKLNNQK